MIEKYRLKVLANSQEKEPKDLIERLGAVLKQGNIDLYAVNGLMRESYEIERQEGYYRDASKFAAMLSEKDPSKESLISVENSGREGWKSVRVDSWEKAFLLGFEPGKTEDIPEYTLDKSGNMTEEVNQFFNQIDKLNRK